MALLAVAGGSAGWYAWVFRNQSTGSASINNPCHPCRHRAWQASVSPSWVSRRAHGFANHRKGLLPDRLAGHDIIRAIEEALIDRGVRHKAVDLDGVGALDLDRFELRILNDEVLALGHLVAAAFVLGGARLAGLFIDELLAQAIAGGLVDLPQRDALGTRAGRMQRNRTGDQSQFEIAFPVGTHTQLLWF